MNRWCTDFFKTLSGTGLLASIGLAAPRRKWSSLSDLPALWNGV